MSIYGTSGAKTLSQLIDALMKHWACWDEHETFYLTELAPTLIANPQSGDETEQRILRELRAQMRDDEWKNLPRILANRRAEILREIESEREAAAQAGRERIRRKRMLEEIDHQFDRNFLSADRFFESAQASSLGKNTKTESEHLSATGSNEPPVVAKSRNFILMTSSLVRLLLSMEVYRLLRAQAAARQPRLLIEPYFSLSTAECLQPIFCCSPSIARPQ